MFSPWRELRGVGRVRVVEAEKSAEGCHSVGGLRAARTFIVYVALMC